MNGLDEFLNELREAALVNGMSILRFDGDGHSGSVTLTDMHGSEIEIRTEYGLRTLAYVKQIKAVKP